MDAEIQSVSPTGRFQVLAQPWEARSGLWVYPPEIHDAALGQVVFELVDYRWSLDRSVWLSESLVELTLRRFPGEAQVMAIKIAFDCFTSTSVLQAKTFANLGLLESAMNELV
jgi:hypothetical protein